MCNLCWIFFSVYNLFSFVLLQCNYVALSVSTLNIGIKMCKNWWSVVYSVDKDRIKKKMFFFFGQKLKRKCWFYVLDYFIKKVSWFYFFSVYTSIALEHFTQFIFHISHDPLPKFRQSQHFTQFIIRLKYYFTRIKLLI